MLLSLHLGVPLLPPAAGAPWLSLLRSYESVIQYLYVINWNVSATKLILPTLRKGLLCPDTHHLPLQGVWPPLRGRGFNSFVAVKSSCGVLMWVPGFQRVLSEYLSEWVIETQSLPMGLSYIVGERSHGHKDQVYEDQTHNQLAIWGGFMKEVALSWALKKGDWGRGCLAFKTERRAEWGSDF